ncbi:hypothetical protein Tco_0823582 [Tanacetum coccineum]|uniref:Uncharacterized protein n=1 Tax=Tanacetum coccineum TaxID=301880 RepID=A0ABQ5AME9_9ASTR
MEEEEVSLVDGVFEGALGALALEMECHGGLWWLIEDEEDGEVVRIAEASWFDVRIEDHHFVQKKRECRMVGNREVR